MFTRLFGKKLEELKPVEEPKLEIPVIHEPRWRWKVDKVTIYLVGVDEPVIIVIDDLMPPYADTHDGFYIISHGDRLIRYPSTVILRIEEEYKKVYYE